MERKTIIWFSRFSLFIIYFWFGALKVFGISPAEKLVEHLYEATLHQTLGLDTFSFYFGFIECALGLIWLFPALTSWAFYALILHLITTFLPTIFLPNDTWQFIFTPTLIGQYIIKNLALLSTAWFVREAHTVTSSASATVE